MDLDVFSARGAGGTKKEPPAITLVEDPRRPIDKVPPADSTEFT
jgi:hypothetical protein